MIHDLTRLARCFEEPKVRLYATRALTTWYPGRVRVWRCGESEVVVVLDRSFARELRAELVGHLPSAPIQNPRAALNNADAPSDARNRPNTGESDTDSDAM